jgi:hypothetical protein
MIELGLGVGVLPVDEHCAALPASLVALPLVPEVSVTTMLVRRRNRSLRPNAEAVWALFAGKELPDHAGASATPGAASVNPAIKGATHEPMPCVPDEALMRAS